MKFGNKLFRGKQTERFELRGEKKEIEYPGMPIDVYLADKRLQIIDVRNDPRWNANYLLIDPTAFDQMDPRTGFKGIRENEPFIVGRNYSWRFEFPNTVSRVHLRIELRAGKLIIEDLNSRNGTVVQIERPRRPGKEQIEAQEARPEKKKGIAEFCEYVEKHPGLEGRWGTDLEDLAAGFYHEFYNNNIDQPKYKEEDPLVKRLIREYPIRINAVRENLSQEIREGRYLQVWDNGYWLSCNTNGGNRYRVGMGRLYFNVKPEYVGQFFLKAVKVFQEAGLHSQMKIPMLGNIETFNRFDKMVVYFDAEEEKKVLEVLDNLYQSAPEIFDEDIPRFTAEVKNQKGEKMRGIGFGEEPPFRNESFGSIRAKILAEVYLAAKNSRRSILDSDFDFESEFRRACLKYQVDPQNPAFNLQRGPEKFLELKRRMG